MRTIFLMSSLLLGLSLSAQNVDFVDVNFYIDESAMVRAVNAQASNLTDLTFHIVSPNTPGAAYPAVPSQTMFLQYTSVKTAAPDDQRQITVDVVGGDFPSGVSLALTAQSAGTGSIGSGNEVELNNSNLTGKLVSTIGSAYSGTGAGQGIPITYALNFATEALDASTAGMVSLQFTLSNN
ncbi:MAG: hypothetical protein NWS34_01650 [Schleiferiaceae bacterium]|jgi:hypothetical protein|nr:hypothetical protein [Schleiferiaceae bacterium]MDP4628383.1 hypothetical protein [Schleiferiaceae bacterium]MDP4773316.1 hypothetical protein [Schleiferiaceae bacterium]MDP4931938.1 hypothetical protein [Schleiferiaceae bacterium]